MTLCNDERSSWAQRGCRRPSSASHQSSGVSSDFTFFSSVFSVVCTYLTCSAVCWRINSTTPVLQSFFFILWMVISSEMQQQLHKAQVKIHPNQHTAQSYDEISSVMMIFSRVFFCCCCCCSSHLSLYYSVSFSSSCLDFDLWFDFFEFSPSSPQRIGWLVVMRCAVIASNVFFILGFCISVRGTCQVAGNWVACDRWRSLEYLKIAQKKNRMFICQESRELFTQFSLVRLGWLIASHRTLILFYLSRRSSSP